MFISVPSTYLNFIRRFLPLVGRTTHLRPCSRKGYTGLMLYPHPVVSNFQEQKQLTVASVFFCASLCQPSLFPPCLSSLFFQRDPPLPLKPSWLNILFHIDLSAESFLFRQKIRHQECASISEWPSVDIKRQPWGELIRRAQMRHKK